MSIFVYPVLFILIQLWIAKILRIQYSAKFVFQARKSKRERIPCRGTGQAVRWRSSGKSKLVEYRRKKKLSQIKWIGSQSISKLKSPLVTLAQCEGEPKNVIIALHGFGDTAANFSHIAKEFRLQNVLWLFVQGPKNVPMAMEGAQWFSLFSDPKEEISASENALFDLIENVKETLELSSDKIFLMGFSQGAGMALYHGLKSQESLAGLICLSGFMIRQSEIIPLLQTKEKFPPVFLAHGSMDQVVFPSLFYETKNCLSLNRNIKLICKNYRMEHTISSEEIADIRKFIEGYRN
jgi:phospholipase/carboxylesterase